MLPGMELMGCTDLAVPAEVMRHVVHVESSSNPYAIGVVGGRLVRQPQNLSEALATVEMLVQRGYNFSLGLAQVNRYNLSRYGLGSYETAFDTCPNLQAGSRILAECYGRSGGDWGKAFSCYYSGNFVTGYRHGYVQKIMTSIRQGAGAARARAIPVMAQDEPRRSSSPVRNPSTMASLLMRRILAEVPTPRLPDILQSPQPVAASAPASPVAAQPAASPIGASQDDAPVTVQPMGATRPAAASPALAGTAGASAGAARPAAERADDAFVF